MNESFRPAAPWLTGHLQTIANQVRKPAWDLGSVGTEDRLIVPMDDGSGDSIAVRIHRPRDGDARRPFVLLVHGLGGSIDSPYIQATAHGLLGAGYPVARIDLRGVGESARISRSLYHGGRSEDLRVVLAGLASLDGPWAHEGQAVVGFSLGGNVTLKLMGEPHPGLDLRAAASVSAPLELASAAEHLQRMSLGLYGRFLVHQLREQTAASGLRLTAGEEAQLRAIRTVTEFDDLFTAKRNGWRDAAEYYEVNSSAQFLPRIVEPTLVVHAIDDPMIPASSYRAVDWVRLATRTPVRRALTARGGHVGFHERGQAMPWYVGRIRRHLDAA